MRLNRKWLYLGGLVTILTLLLTLTLVLPAGAVGQLDPGTLSTDADYVSPDMDLPDDDRTVKVTLSNGDLDGLETVGRGDDPDHPVVEFVVSERIDATNVASITVNIRAKAGTSGVTTALRTDTELILPVVDNLELLFDRETVEDSGTVDPNELGDPVIRNRADGIIDIPVLASIEVGETIALAYDTSPQETALVNVSGDSDNFDLLTIESAAGPATDYSGTFVAADRVVLDMGNVVHEQHRVPSGLRGFVEFEDEAIAKRYSDQALTKEIDDDLSENTDFFIRVANPPIRDGEDTGIEGDIESEETNSSVAEVVHADMGIVRMTVDQGKVVRASDDVSVTYLGSDDFSFEVRHGPIQNPEDIEIVVPAVDSDGSPSIANKLEIIEITDGQDSSCDMCRVRMGVLAASTSKDDAVKDLSPRISVLGISYKGSERLNIPSGDKSEFTARLDFQPVDRDGDDDVVDQLDIEVLGSSQNGLEITVKDGEITKRDVTFVVSGGPVEADTTVDVEYSLEVGANPRNALLPDEDNRPVIAVTDGARVSITSGNERATVNAEMEGPSYSNPSPAHKGATSDDDQLISLDVTDDLAGVKKDSIVMMLEVDDGDTLTVANEDLEIDEITGGYRVSIELDDIDTVNINASVTTPVAWYVMASDKASNASTSDAVADNVDDDDEPARDNYTFNVDGEAPAIERAFTGDWFDITDNEVKGDRRLGVADGEVVYLPGSSDNTSLRVVFNEPIDSSTVSADDFTVDGDAPSAADAYPEGDTGFDNDAEPITRSVFLTVPSMEADATPMVALVGSVSDVAGNSVSSDSEEANDGIAPSPTLIVDTALSGRTVVITVETDERIFRQSPDLNLFISNGPDRDEGDTFTFGYEGDDEDNLVLMMGESTVADPAANNSDYELTLSKAPILPFGDAEKVLAAQITAEGSTETDGATIDVTVDEVLSAENGTVRVTVKKSGANDVLVDLEEDDSFTLTYRGTDADPAPGPSGGVPSASGRQVSATSWTFTLNLTKEDRFAASATVEDASRNRGVGGIADPMANGATVFQIDNQLANGEQPTTKPLHDPAGNDPVSIADPFYITLEWNDEAEEYPGDTNAGVTLTKALLDGEDVVDAAVAQDPNTYRLAISGIELGSHTVVYNAEDVLGNSHSTDRVLRFTVQPVPTWDLSLSAGFNLISLPSAPVSRDINDVFGSTEEIDLVYTFEGAQSKVALRNPDDPTQFIGTLDTIDSEHAYWVSAANSAKVEINIPPFSRLAPPPYIAVAGGQWNLVPVISLEPVDRGAAPGTEIDPDDYLGDFRTAFGWDGDRWLKFDPNDSDDLTDDDEGDTLRIGMGYWVLYDEDSIVTP